MEGAWSQALSRQHGLTPAQLKSLEKLNVRSVADLLLYLPLRYEDRSHITPVAALRDGDKVLVLAKVYSSRTVHTQRPILYVQLVDEAGDFFQLVYFNFYASTLKQFIHGRRGLFYGEVRLGPYGFSMSHPDIEWLKDDQPPDLPEHLIPVYPSIKSVQQKTLRKATAAVLAQLDLSQASLLPEKILKQYHLPDLGEALQRLHFPSSNLAHNVLEDIHAPARLSLILEELLAHQCSLLLNRQAQQLLRAPPLAFAAELHQRFLDSLPFQLTSDQQRAIRAIGADLSRSSPMMRLLQGDVGSGKTMVAFAAALQAVAAGQQAVLMAPTELLAEQHHANAERFLAPLGIRCALLSSKSGGQRQRRELLQGITTGETQLIIGTHAVFQEQVNYAKLALIIIDEQHRFGVEQRFRLQEKNSSFQPHQLVMSATPIPRTLAMSLYADMDVSVLKELPPGRKPVLTAVCPQERREEVFQRLNVLCEKGKQAYWVCPLIEESPVLQCQTAEDTAYQLRQALPHRRIALVHGRLKSEERRSIMEDFKARHYEILVATTVIEVGVDVPNACLMVIENAERFGLSQLHQLRGRVGRGSEAAYCLLLYQAPLSETAQKRLEIIRREHDGFAIAEADLQLRGVGELLGTRQTGVAGLRVADIVRDSSWLPQVQEWAQELLQHDPARARALADRWLADKQNYSRV